MANALGVTDYVVVCVMLAISASIGLYFRFTGGRQKTTEEFLMAGKNMNILPVAFSLMATYMSAISLLGVPAETYMYGTQCIMWIVVIPLGGFIAAYGILPILYDLEVSTSYEYLEKRYSKRTRTIASSLYTLQMILYMGIVLYAPSLALNVVTGLSTWVSVLVLALVCTFYCSLGGLKAVLWTDVFQSTLMYVAIIAVVVKGSLDVGGIVSALNIAEENGRMIFFDTSADFTTRYTLWNALISGFQYCVDSYGTNQAQVQRMMSIGNLKKAQMSLLLSLILVIFFEVFCYWDGTVIYANYRDCDPMMQHDGIDSQDQLMPYAILNMFRASPGLSGLCIAGIFSASLSTISSGMNSLTAMTVEDFIRPHCFCKRLSESWMAFLAKLIAVGYGGLCVLITFLVSNFRGVLEASGVLAGIISGPLFGIFALGMFTTTANEEGTLFGLLAGLLFSAWVGYGSSAANVTIPTLSRSVVGCPENINVNETQTFPTPPNPNFMYTELENITSTETNAVEVEGYVFPLYKVSFLWIPVIGTTVTILVGYIASFIRVIELFSPGRIENSTFGTSSILFYNSESCKERGSAVLFSLNSEFDGSLSPDTPYEICISLLSSQNRYVMQRYSVGATFEKIVLDVLTRNLEQLKETDPCRRRIIQRPELLSPFVRKWYFQSASSKSPADFKHEIEMKLEAKTI